MGVKEPKYPYRIAEVIELPAKVVEPHTVYVDRVVERIVEVEDTKAIMEMNDRLADAQKEIARLKGQLSSTQRTVEKIVEVPVQVEVLKEIFIKTPNVVFLYVGIAGALVGAAICYILR